MTDETEFETALRRELQTTFVPFDEARAAQMIDAASVAQLDSIRRSWIAPLAAAAAVVTVGGGAAYLAAGPGSDSGSAPAGGAPVCSSASDTPSPVTSGSEVAGSASRHFTVTTVDSAGATESYTILAAGDGTEQTVRVNGSYGPLVTLHRAGGSLFPLASAAGHGASSAPGQGASAADLCGSSLPGVTPSASDSALPSGCVRVTIDVSTDGQSASPARGLRCPVTNGSDPAVSGTPLPSGTGTPPVYTPPSATDGAPSDNSSASGATGRCTTVGPYDIAGSRPSSTKSPSILCQVP